MGNGSNFSENLQIERDIDEIDGRELSKRERTKALIDKSAELISTIENELANVEDELMESIEHLEEMRDKFLDGSFREGRAILGRIFGCWRFFPDKLGEEEEGKGSSKYYSH